MICVRGVFFYFLSLAEKRFLPFALEDVRILTIIVIKLNHKMAYSSYSIFLSVVVTSSPSNEAELQLYRVLQRASLLAYYDTLLEMGLCDEHSIN